MPALYRRFRTREDILRALVGRYQQQLFEQLKDAESLTQAAQTFFDFALRQPREYELMMSGLLARMTEERPNLELLAHRCAEWYGGRARDYRELVFAVAALAHGAAMLKISGVFRQQESDGALAACLRSLDVLARYRDHLREQ